MEKFKAVLDLQSKHRSALGYGLVTLLTAGGEKIFSEVVFQCPCSATWNLPYGLVFLLVPALALFVLGYALSARTWRLLTGCCSGSRSTSSSSWSHSAFVCARLTAGATVPAVTWVAVALLGGSFYQCAVSGSTYMAKRLCQGRDDSCVDKLPLVPCNKQEAEMQDILSQLKAQSQVLGWVLIAVVIVLLLAVKSVTRCFSPVSYLQLQFWEIYTEKEGQILQKAASENATQLAQENVRCFFECSDPRECKTPSSKAWQHISALYTFNSKNQFYSMLHKYVNRKGAAGGLSSMEGDAAVSALGFIDDSGMVNTNTSI
ncbi:calcium homeostasis modulator protein 6 [Peromyscus californicus insignis]|uniref:calcium homeostasis modulator protein 6 n=1 Tax=Peromyscus californicus insignis TaxID=564181 RepID=UPI0022A67699|nr:calcium homeostasis modulator protein 6 [Peromyscus californicus insignis]